MFVDGVAVVDWCQSVATDKRRAIAADALDTARRLHGKRAVDSRMIASISTEIAFHLLQADRSSRYDGPRPLELIIVTRRARRRIQVDYVEHYAAIPRAEWLNYVERAGFVSAGPGAGKSQ